MATKRLLVKAGKNSTFFPDKVKEFLNDWAMCCFFCRLLASATSFWIDWLG
jgi:hypothetical protein